MKLHYLLLPAISLLLTACSVLRQGDPTVGVDISGVNYSDQPITYILSDPKNPESVAAEPIDPFAAGGSICCFSLPEKWQPGIKVRVQILDTNRDPVKDEIVDLPPYVDGQPGRIWAVHYQDGSVDVLSSEYGPTNAKWPGKVKGWPVPTVEYRRKVWALHLDIKLGTLRAAQELLEELRDSTDERLQKSWEHNQRYNRKEIASFTGPMDPAYKEYLRKFYEQFFIDAQQDVDDWKKRKP